MEQELKQALARRQKAHIVDASRMPSAVLVPLYHKNGEHYILLTQRTEEVKDHKGQISFPGGAYEERDGTLLNTCLRECAEEIGLAPEAIELLGELDDICTVTSGYIISPFVASIPWPYPFRLDPVETKEIIEVPLSALRDKDYIRQETINGRTATSYHYQGRIVFGATATILRQFLEIWAGVMEQEGH